MIGARKLTIDASVYLAALDRADDGTVNEARLFLRQVLSEGYELHLPRLFLLELIVALRALLNVKSVYSALARQWAIAENVRWLDADSSFTRAACELADKADLRVSDAIYAVSARVSGGVLVSLDPGMIQRVGQHVSVLTPTAFLGTTTSTAAEIPSRNSENAPISERGESTNDN